MARQTKLTPEMQTRIITAIQLGLTHERAAAASGIGQSTFYQWLEKGRAGRAPYAGLVEALKKAEAEGEAALLARIHAASREGTWQASAWMLERRWPERYALRARLEHTGAGGSEMTLRLTWGDGRDVDEFEAEATDISQLDQGQPEAGHDDPAAAAPSGPAGDSE